MGMIIETDNFKILQGDCLKLLPHIPDQTVDLILCDLPYGTTENKWDTPIDLAALWVQYKRICRGAILLTAQTPFDKVLGVSNLPMLRYEWIWEKSAATGFLNAKKAPLKAHENVLVFYKNKTVYNPIMTPGNVIKRVKASYADHGDNYGKGLSVRKAYESTERYPRSVLKFPKDNRLLKLHPTQKPIALMEYLIKTYSSPGAIVLDNAMGSGSTGLACMTTGRYFIGMELQSKYFAIAAQRLLLK